MEIKVLKTIEIAEEYWNQIAAGHNACFEGHVTTAEHMKETYTSNLFGFCYHAIALDGEKVIGFNTYTPYKYLFDDREIIVALSGTTFVLKEYRKDIFIFADMCRELNAYCKNENVVLSMGVSNGNSYKYAKIIMKSHDLLSLNYYILPVRIGNILKKVRFLNVFSMIAAYIILFINRLFSFVYNSNEKVARCHICNNREFLDCRLKRNIYKKDVSKDYYCSYRISVDDEIKCAYIMCAYQNSIKTYKALVRCVSNILHNENVDMIMFNGTMRLHQGILFKVPKRLEPRLLPLNMGFTDKSYKQQYEALLDGNNWDFSLINLDVR